MGWPGLAHRVYGGAYIPTTTPSLRDPDPFFPAYKEDRLGISTVLALVLPRCDPTRGQPLSDGSPAASKDREVLSASPSPTGWAPPARVCRNEFDGCPPRCFDWYRSTF